MSSISYRSDSVGTRCRSYSGQPAEHPPRWCPLWHLRQAADLVLRRCSMQHLQWGVRTNVDRHVSFCASCHTFPLQAYALRVSCLEYTQYVKILTTDVRVLVTVRWKCLSSHISFITLERLVLRSIDKRTALISTRTAIVRPSDQ